MLFYLRQGDASDDRTFALASETADGPCLTLTRVSGRSATVQIALVSRKDLDLTSDRTRKVGGRIYGCLGVLSIGIDTFLCVIDAANHVGTLSSGAAVSRIQAVSFHCLTSAQFDNSTLNSLSPDYQSGDVDLSSVHHQGGQGTIEHPCAGIRKYLSSGSFYFSSTFDLSSRLQARLERGTSDVGVYDERFLWNFYAVECLLSFRNRLGADERSTFDLAGFATLAIQGFVSIVTLYLPGPPGPTTVAIISRLSWKRAGTRFLTRGLDDEGNVANFVESELVVRTPVLAFSYVQLRGSVPLFWEQQGLQPFVQKVQITRPQIASQPAFDRHFLRLLETYPSLHVLNLLGTRDAEESLTRAYTDHLSGLKQAVEASRIGYTSFDFHNRARGPGGLESVRDQLRADPKICSQDEKFAFCMASIDDDGEEVNIVQTQDGVFRTNCLDCLDRTNVVQEILSRTALEHFVLNANPSWLGAEQLWSIHRNLWAENGDALSKIYAGTGALNSSFTRSGRTTLAGALANATKSVGRVIQANFADKDKQASVDGLLGNLAGQVRVVAADPIHDALDAELESRKPEFSSFSSATLFCGTWNLNARPKAPNDSLVPWLFPDPAVEPDLMAIGFQELVDLNATQILSTDYEKKRQWEAQIMQAVNSRPDRKSDYIVLRSGQLVGTALILLIKTSLIDCVRNIEVAFKKTGLKGVAGNKGAVAIRLDYRDSAICFITAHLAAGHAHVDDRNRDYQTIAVGLHFLRGKTIDTHDHVIWFGDFNYRIDLPGETVRQMVSEDTFAPLLEADQLSHCKSSGLAFAGYDEGPITFQPTYRYDLGTTIYDSSEKQRIPAWTDRVLYRGKGLDLNRYARAELLSSDHRPVLALLRARIRVIDQDHRSQIRSDILARLTAEAANGSMPDLSTMRPQVSLKNGLPPPPVPVKIQSPMVKRKPAPSAQPGFWWEDVDAGADFVPATSSNPFDDLPPSLQGRRAPPAVPRRPGIDRHASNTSSLLD